MPQVSLPPGVTDEAYVLALLRATGVLCVYGSGFGTKPEDGFFRVVFLASPRELSEIFDLVADFTRDFLAKPALSEHSGRGVNVRRPPRSAPSSATRSRWLRWRGLSSGAPTSSATRS